MRTTYILRSDDRPTTDDRPTDLTFWKISNGHISATGHPIHLTFGSRVGFLRSADRIALFAVGPNPRRRLLEILERPYLGNGSSNPPHVWF